MFYRKGQTTIAFPYQILNFSTYLGKSFSLVT